MLLGSRQIFFLALASALALIQPAFAQNEDLSRSNPIQKMAWETIRGVPLDLSSPEQRLLFSIYISNYYRGSSRYIHNIPQQIDKMNAANQEFPDLFQRHFDFSSAAISLTETTYHAQAEADAIFQTMNMRANVIFKRNFDMEPWKDFKNPAELIDNAYDFAKTEQPNIPELEVFLKNESLRPRLWEHLIEVVHSRYKFLRGEERVPYGKLLRWLLQTYSFSDSAFLKAYGSADGYNKIMMLKAALVDVPREAAIDILKDPKILKKIPDSGLLAQEVINSNIATLNQLSETLEVNETKTKHLNLRQLHPHEMPFLSRLGYHCTTSSYHDFRQFNERPYVAFTLTNGDSVSKGAVVLMFGTTKGAEGSLKPIAVVEQIDNINHQWLDAVLESIRRIVRGHGYELHFPEDLKDGTNLAISNESQIVKAIRKKKYFLNGETHIGFKPIEHTQRFNPKATILYQLSRTRKIDPIPLTDEVSIHVRKVNRLKQGKIFLKDIVSYIEKLEKAEDPKSLVQLYKSLKVLVETEGFELFHQHAQARLLSFGAYPPEALRAMVDYAQTLKRSDPKSPLLMKMFEKAISDYQAKKITYPIYELLEYVSSVTQDGGNQELVVILKSAAKAISDEKLLRRVLKQNSRNLYLENSGEYIAAIQNAIKLKRFAIADIWFEHTVSLFERNLRDLTYDVLLQATLSGNLNEHKKFKELIDAQRPDLFPQQINQLIHEFSVKHDFDCIEKLRAYALENKIELDSKSVSAVFKCAYEKTNMSARDQWREYAESRGNEFLAEAVNGFIHTNPRAVIQNQNWKQYVRDKGIVVESKAVGAVLILANRFPETVGDGNEWLAYARSKEPVFVASTFNEILSKCKEPEDARLWIDYVIENNIVLNADILSTFLVEHEGAFDGLQLIRISKYIRSNSIHISSEAFDAVYYYMITQTHWDEVYPLKDYVFKQGLKILPQIVSNVFAFGIYENAFDLVDDFLKYAEGRGQQFLKEVFEVLMGQENFFDAENFQRWGAYARSKNIPISDLYFKEMLIVLLNENKLDWISEWATYAVDTNVQIPKDLVNRLIRRCAGAHQWNALVSWSIHGRKFGYGLSPQTYRHVFNYSIRDSRVDIFDQFMIEARNRQALGELVTLDLQSFETHLVQNVPNYLQLRESARVKLLPVVVPKASEEAKPVVQAEPKPEVDGYTQASRRIVQELNTNLIENTWLDVARFMLAYDVPFSQYIQVCIQMYHLKSYYGDRSQPIKSLEPKKRNELFQNLSKLRVLNLSLPADVRDSELETNLQKHFVFKDDSIEIKTDICLDEVFDLVNKITRIVIDGEGIPKSEWRSRYTPRVYQLLKIKTRKQVLESLLLASENLSDEEVVRLVQELGRGEGGFKKYFLELKVRLNFEQTLETGQKVRPYAMIIESLHSTLNTVISEAELPIEFFKTKKSMARVPAGEAMERPRTEGAKARMYEALMRMSRK